MSGGLLSLTYVSSAVGRLTLLELEELLEQARPLNREAGITGMLLYRDGNIIQVLEGDPAAVEETYQRIRRDPRHRGVVELDRSYPAERAFGSWAMALREVAPGPDGPEGYSDFLRRPAADGRDEEPGGSTGAAWTLLRMFRDAMR